VLDHKKIVKLTNVIGLIAVLALFYWIVIWSVNEIFGLRVFRETLSESFSYSIAGILALLAGALTLNVMLNLSFIAENTAKKSAAGKLKSNLPVWLISFAVILLISIILMFAGDYGTTKKREKALENSARMILSKYSGALENISRYNFSSEWQKEVMETFTLIEKVDADFNSIHLLVPDQINGNAVYLSFRNYYYPKNATNDLKINYIVRLTSEERAYLDKVFNQNYSGKYFKASKGQYQLYLPYESRGGKVVFSFSNYEAYGQYGKSSIL
jgi:ABC-type multidrug transport system fused ATPase/permease subunit